MDPHNTQLCKCGHDLNMHGLHGCTAGNSNGRQCSCSRSQTGALALLNSPDPSPVSLQPVSESNADAILTKFWAMQEHHQAAHEEQMRILRERRTQSGKKLL